MGIALSCPFADFDDLDCQFDAVLMKSIKFGDVGMKTAFRSVSFNGRDTEPAMLRFKGRNLNATFSFRSPTSEMEKELLPGFLYPQNGEKNNQSLSEIKHNLQFPELGNRRHQAAVKLQKVYKSFRTRRQLADCAVVVEQRWWKLLDFAELKRSSISFFDIEKPETAISRWSRARKRAAKEKVCLRMQRLGSLLYSIGLRQQIDPRHRYGHNLQFYYVKWLHCQSTQPFFYWLDIGDGKEISLDRCPRSKLQQQGIKYLGPTEREAYEVVLKDGKFVHKQSGELLDTTGGLKDTKWIFVLSTSKTLYVGMKKKGTFQHSSFLAGGATLSAGRLIVENGVLKAVWPHSGHYLPTEENFQEFLSFLREHNVDLTNVKESPAEEEEGEAIIKKWNSRSLQKHQLDVDFCQDPKVSNVKSLPQEHTVFREQDSNAAENTEMHRSKLVSSKFRSTITKLQIPTRGDVHENFREVIIPITPLDVNYESAEDSFSPDDDGYESAEDSFLSEEDFMFPKRNLFNDEEKEDEEPIPKEKILQRISSHKEMNSYQLARQLSSKWTTGAGPRIGCMRDYPSELQFWVLEQANWSPRGGTASSSSTPWNESRISPRHLTPTSPCSLNNSSAPSRRETIQKSLLGPGIDQVATTAAP